MKLLKNSTIYTVSIMIQGLSVFILIPFYTKYLSTSEYGIIAVINSMSGFLAIFYTFALQNGLIRFYSECKKNNVKTKKLFSTIFTFLFINSSILTLVLIMFGRSIIEGILKGVVFFPYIFLSLLSISFNSIFNIFLVLLQAEQKGEKYGLFYITFNLTTVIFTIVFLSIFHFKILGVLIALLGANIIYFLIVLINIIPKINFYIDKKLLKELIKYSFPLILNGLFSWATIFINKIILNNIKSASSAGIYDIGFYLGSVMIIFPSAINQAYLPWFFEKIKGKRKDRLKIIKFAEFAILFYSFIALVISFYGKDLVTFWVTRDFRDSWMIVPFISFSYVINGIYYFFVNILLYHKRYIKYMPISSFISAIINILLNFLLIPQFGIIGSAFATFIAVFISSLIIVFISDRLDYFAFNRIKIFLIPSLFFIISFINFSGKVLNPTHLLISKTTIIFLIIFFAYIFFKKDLLLFKDIIFKKSKL